MPQKRNPMVLDRIRGLAGVAVGWPTSHLGVMHMATSSDVDQSYVQQCAETVEAVPLLRELGATVEFDTDAVRVSAGRHWSTVSALAAGLVIPHGLNFRDAHESVVHLVAAHKGAGFTTGELRHELTTDGAASCILTFRAAIASRISLCGWGVRR